MIGLQFLTALMVAVISIGRARGRGQPRAWTAMIALVGVTALKPNVRDGAELSSTLPEYHKSGMPIAIATLGFGVWWLSRWNPARLSP